HQKSKIRSTPWGEMTYIDYKHRVEFGIEEYAEIDRYAKEVGLQWFASPWDTDSVDFLENEFDALTYTVASRSEDSHVGRDGRGVKTRTLPLYTRRRRCARPRGAR